jgi:hypothetical protein
LFWRARRISKTGALRFLFQKKPAACGGRWCVFWRSWSQQHLPRVGDIYLAGAHRATTVTSSTGFAKILAAARQARSEKKCRVASRTPPVVLVGATAMRTMTYSTSGFDGTVCAETAPTAANSKTAALAILDLTVFPPWWRNTHTASFDASQRGCVPHARHDLNQGAIPAAPQHEKH